MSWSVPTMISLVRSAAEKRYDKEIISVAALVIFTVEKINRGKNKFKNVQSTNVSFSDLFLNIATMQYGLALYCQLVHETHLKKYIFQMPNDYRSLLLGFNNTHNVLIVWKRLPVMWTPSLPHHRHSSADITGYRRQTNIRFFVVRMQRFLIIKFVIWQLHLYLGLLVHFFMSFF